MYKKQILFIKRNIVYVKWMKYYVIYLLLYELFVFDNFIFSLLNINKNTDFFF